MGESDESGRMMSGRIAVKAIHQLIPTLLAKDATGTHTLLVRDHLRSLGLDSHIFVSVAQPELASEVSLLSDIPAGRLTDTVFWYQMAVASPLTEFVRGRNEPIVVNYHNITPPEYFEHFDPDLVSAQREGLAQVEELASRAELAVAVSRFNADDLMARGYDRVDVAPVLADLMGLDSQVSGLTLHRLEREKRLGGSDWLFVGRLVPNKAQHDLIAAFAAYRQIYDPRARLHLVGRPASASYRAALVGQVDSLGLTGSVRFLDQGISQADLAAHYRAADCFVSCSEHEGFCVPLLEAMHHHLPIVAFRSSAIPETLGGAGIVLDTKEPLRLAAAAASVIGDRDLRSRLDRLAQLRLAEMSLISGRRRLSQVIVEHFDFSERDRVIAELLAEPVEGGESAHSGSSA